MERAVYNRTSVPSSEVVLGSVGHPGSSLEKFSVVELLSYELKLQRLNCPTMGLAALLLLSMWCGEE